jgi:hypothetical protein
MNGPLEEVVTYNETHSFEVDDELSYDHNFILLYLMLLYMIVVT